MDRKPLEPGCPQTVDEKTSSLACSDVGTHGKKKRPTCLVGLGLSSWEDGFYREALLEFLRTQETGMTCLGLQKKLRILEQKTAT